MRTFPIVAFTILMLTGCGRAPAVVHCKSLDDCAAAQVCAHSAAAPAASSASSARAVIFNDSSEERADCRSVAKVAALHRKSVPSSSCRILPESRASQS